MPVKSSQNSQTLKADSVIVYTGLYHLHAEAKLPRPKRDQTAIRETWRIIKPLLVKYQMFDEIKGNAMLRSKLKFFLHGTF